MHAWTRGDTLKFCQKHPAEIWSLLTDGCCTNDTRKREYWQFVCSYSLTGISRSRVKLDCWTHALRFLNFFWMHVTNCFFLFNASCWFGVKRKMFHATDEEIPQRKGPSLSHELRVWEGRRRMLTAATSSKFYGRKLAFVAYACQLLPRILFIYKKLGLTHSLSVGQSSYLHSDQAQQQKLTIIQVLLILVKLITRLRVDHRTEFSADHDVSRPKRWRRNDRSVPSWSTSSCRSNLSLSYQIS